MRTVVVESPYAGDIERNTRYALFCLHDCIVNHNEAPFASHLLYTQPNVLEDEGERVVGQDTKYRQLGIDAGLEWSKQADATVVYTDIGMSRGMQYGIDFALKLGRPIEYRHLPEHLWVEFEKIRFAYDQPNDRPAMGEVILKKEKKADA